MFFFPATFLSRFLGFQKEYVGINGLAPALLLLAAMLSTWAIRRIVGAGLAPTPLMAMSVKLTLTSELLLCHAERVSRSPERSEGEASQCLSPHGLLACHYPQIVERTASFAGTGSGIDIGALIGCVPRHDSGSTPWYVVCSGTI